MKYAARLARRGARPAAPPPSIPAPPALVVPLDRPPAVPPATPAPQATPALSKAERKRLRKQARADAVPASRGDTPPGQAVQGRPEPVPAGADRFRRPPAMSVLAFVDLLGAVALFVVVATLSAGRQATESRLVDIGRAAAGTGGVLLLLTTAGIWRLRPFGIWLQRLIAWTGLLAVPFGTLFSLVVLAYLARPGVRLLYSGRSPRSLSTAERAQVGGSAKLSGLMAVVLFVLAALAATSVAAVVTEVVPAVTRLIGATETAGKGTPSFDVDAEVRTFVAAQQTYANVNGGFFDSMACLRNVAACIPGAPAQASDVVLDERFLQDVRSDHMFVLRLGPRPAEPPAGVSPTSVSAFTYVALPMPAVAGASSVCGDHTGRVCRFDVTTVGPLTGDACPTACTPVP